MLCYQTYRPDKSHSFGAGGAQVPLRLKPVTTGKITMRSTQQSLLLVALGLMLSGCSYLPAPNSVFNGQPAYVSAKGETASVETIELAFADGRGVGAFMSAIDPQNDPALAASQRYRIGVVFDSGNHTVLVQDGTVPLAIGQRVKLEAGRALPTDRPDAWHPAPTASF